MKLSKRQEEVMKWLRGGWTTEPGAGMAIHINGKRVCNVDTMHALERHGLVEPIVRNGFREVGQWKASLSTGIGNEPNPWKQELR